MIIQPAGVSGAGKEALNLLISKVDGRIGGTKDTLRLLSTTSDLQSGDMAAIQPVLAHLRKVIQQPPTHSSMLMAPGIVRVMRCCDRMPVHAPIILP